jgi:hypothetical protein
MGYELHKYHEKLRSLFIFLILLKTKCWQVVREWRQAYTVENYELLIFA